MRRNTRTAPWLVGLAVWLAVPHPAAADARAHAKEFGLPCPAVIGHYFAAECCKKR